MFILDFVIFVHLLTVSYLSPVRYLFAVHVSNALIRVQCLESCLGASVLQTRDKPALQFQMTMTSYLTAPKATTHSGKTSSNHTALPAACASPVSKLGRLEVVGDTSDRAYIVFTSICIAVSDMVFLEYARLVYYSDDRDRYLPYPIQALPNSDVAIITLLILSLISTTISAILFASLRVRRPSDEEAQEDRRTAHPLTRIFTLLHLETIGWDSESAGRCNIPCASSHFYFLVAYGPICIRLVRLSARARHYHNRRRFRTRDYFSASNSFV